MTNDKAQMMVLESVIFGITVMVALTFLVQLSPTSIQQSSKSTTDLKILCDDALQSLSIETLDIHGGILRETTNNPSSKLAVAIITNNYTEITNTLNGEILPGYALYQYNIFISNGTVTKFWCSWTGYPSDGPRPHISEQVAVSHCIVAIDPVHLTGFHDLVYYDGDESHILQDFAGYEGATYDVMLELWTI